MTLPLLSPAPQRQTLRPYQTQALDDLRALMSQGVHRLLLVLPTGAGKTTVAAEMIHSAVSRRRKVLFLAHRKELIDQASARLDQFTVPHGVIMAGHRRHNPLQPVQVASVQTLVRRRHPPADLVIVDEAHHARANTYQKILDSYPSAPVIGLTATPWRMDGKGLGELFDDTVAPVSVHELTEQGYLVPVTGFAYDSPDLRHCRTRGGDYERKGMELAMGGSVIAGNIVEQYLRHARGKRALLFAASVRHSEDLVSRFRAQGIPAEHVDGTTDRGTREGVFARLSSGDTLVVSNVGVATEGTDIPAVEVCILARPTKSVGLYLQMVGRVLRPYPGKPVARIHDHAGCILTHGLPADERDLSLDADVSVSKSEKAPRPLRQCMQCYAIWDPSGKPACPMCGWERPAAEIREVTTELREVAIEDIQRQSQQQISATAEIQALIRKMHATDPREDYRRLQREAEEKGWKPRAAAMRFKSRHGFWPPKAWEQR